MSTAPKFHLERVFDDGEASAPEILTVLDFPADARLNRREFVGTGVTIATALASMASAAAEAQPRVPPPPGRAPDRPVSPVNAHAGSVYALAFAADARTFVSAGGDEKIKVWSFPGAKLKRAIPIHGSKVELGAMADGHTLAAEATESEAHIWRLPTGTPDKRFQVPSRITAMTIGRDGRTVGIASQDGSIRLWSAQSSDIVRELTAPGATMIQSLALSFDGQFLAAGQPGRRGTLWNLGRNSEPVALSGQQADFRDLEFAPDGSYLVSTTVDGKVALWSIPQGSPRLRSLGPRGRANRLLVTPDSQRIVCGCSDGSIAILSVARLRASYETLAGHERSISAMALSSDGKTLVTGDHAGVIILWDLEKGERLGYAFDPAASRTDGATFSVRDSVTAQIVTYTLPCGSPIPAGATCVCNCVPGTYRPPVRPSRSYGGSRRICTCDKVCTCVPVRSDRDLKTDFQAVDPRAILERLATLPISEWRYRDDHPSVRHIGPMAQDFAAAFHVGDDERTIHGVDAQGIAMSAIQALHRSLAETLEAVKAQQARIEALARQVEELRGVARSD